MSKKQKVLDILRRQGFINNLDVVRGVYGFISLRLSDIIFQLGNEGLIELDNVKSGFLPNSKNWRYCCKPFKVKITEYRVNGEVVSKKSEYVQKTLLDNNK